VNFQALFQISGKSVINDFGISFGAQNIGVKHPVVSITASQSSPSSLKLRRAFFASFRS
jgi:hypothetical protein